MEEKISAIIAILKDVYPDAPCALQYKKDYELMISVRLAAQCTDARVNQITPALFAAYPTLEAMAAADISDVEDSTIFQSVFRDVCIGKGIIGAGAMEEDPVNTGDRHHDTVGCGTLRIHHQTARAVGSQNIPDHSAERVISHLTQKPHIRAQLLQRQAGVGHTAACGDIGRVHMDQPAGHHQLPDIRAVGTLRENRCNINTDMSCSDDFLFHSSIPFGRKFSEDCVHSYLLL